jgi:hypothetical protein
MALPPSSGQAQEKRYEDRTGRRREAREERGKRKKHYSDFVLLED